MMHFTHTRLASCISLLLCLFIFNQSFAQVNLDASISGSTITTCDTLFYDSGGPSGNMAGGGNYNVTFCPTVGTDFINVRFDWNTSANDLPSKRFEIFDGNSMSATEIYDTFDDNSNFRYKLNGATFYAGMSGSGDGSNCLTFEIEGSASAAGWSARIFCTDTNVSPNDEICDAIPLTLGATTTGNNYFATRTCVAGTTYANYSNGYDYGYYAENTTYRTNISDVFYSFVAPNSGAVTTSLQRDAIADDDFIPVQKLFYVNDCNAICSSNNGGDFTSTTYGKVSHASTATNGPLYYSNYPVNGQITFSYTGLTPGQTYYLMVGGVHHKSSDYSVMIDGNTCGSAGVFTGDYTLEVSNNTPCEDQYGNSVIPSSNDDYCYPNSLGIECNETAGDNKCATLNGCNEPNKLQFFLGSAGSSSSSEMTGTVYYEYIPKTVEIGQQHFIAVSGLDCYQQTAPTTNVSSTDIKVYYALWSIPDTGSACNDLIGGSTLVSQGLTSTVSTGSDQPVIFTPAAGEKYILGIAGYKPVSSSKIYDCAFDISINVYEDINVNAGLPAAYICDFPDAPTASLEFNMAGGRGDYTVNFETDGSAVGTWTGGAMEVTTAMIDTVSGSEIFKIDGLSDGDFWSVTYDDGLGCTYFESGTYDFSLWCDICDGYTKLDIILADSAACPGEEILLEPLVDGAYPTPFYAGGSMNRPYKTTYGSGKQSFYNNPSQQELDVTEPSIASGSAQVEEICITAFSYYWNYLDVTMQIDGCGTPVSIWKGSKAGGNDKGLGNSYGRGYQTFCLTTGWNSDTYGQAIATDWDSYGGYSQLNTDWSGCNPDDPIVFNSKNTKWAYAYFYPYKLSAKVLDYIVAQSASFKPDKALQWIPETPAISPFTPSISDGSELSYTPFTDPDSLTATFVETVPGTYIYRLIGIDGNGCKVGYDVNHGTSVTGQGRFSITVYNDPVIDGVTYEDELCFGGSTDINAAVTAGENNLDDTVGYKWTITGTTGDAQGFLTKGNTSATTMLTSGTGTVSFNLKVTDNRGCSDSYDGVITINPNCPADAGSY